MGSSLMLGIVLTLLAGVMSGNCMLPMKFSKGWQWENIWLVFTLVSLVVLPWSLALILVKHLFEVYRSLTFVELGIPFLFGAGWGIAQVLFGISIKRLGMGLGYAIIVGLGALLGTLVPLFVQHRAQVGAKAMLEILTGVAVMILGIGVSAWAGQMREREAPAAVGKDGEIAVAARTSVGSGYFAAVFLAVLCGVMAPMVNFSFAFGQAIANHAVLLGNSEIHAAYAIWPVGLAGGFVVNTAYSLYLIQKRRSWSAFGAPSQDVVLPIMMGILWMGAIALYGMSATYFGSLGTSVGWGIMQIFQVMAATLSGVLTGEWKGASSRAQLLLVCGLVCLTIAMSMLAMGNS